MMVMAMGPRLESDLLRTFIAVADACNVTRAAETVGRTQSAVSMQIRKLEGVAGFVLFERGSRGVALTEKGEHLLTSARRIVALLDETEASLRLPQLKGTVRIGIPEEYVHSILPNALGAFDKMHPDVEVTVRYGSSPDNVAALEKGELDIAVMFARAGDSRHEVLMTDPTVWVTSDTHCTHERRPLPVAMYADVGWCNVLAAAALDSRGIGFRVAYVSATCAGLTAAVTSGLAVAPLSRSSIPPGCRELTVDDGFGAIDLSNVVMRLKGTMQDAAVQGMATAVREAFRNSATALA